MGKRNKRLSVTNTATPNKNRLGSEQIGTAESHLAMLSDVARLLSGTGDFEDKTRQVAERMARAAGADWVALRISDDYASGLKLVASAGYESQTSPIADILEYNQGMAGRAYTDAKSIIAHEYKDHADALQHNMEIGVKSGLALPILFDGKVTGVFVFGSRESGHFTDNRVGLLEAVAYQLGPLLENAKLHQELAVTDEIARIITSTLDIHEVYERFAIEVKKLVDFERIAISVIDIANGTYTLKYVSGRKIPARNTGEAQPLAGTISQHLLQTGLTMIRREIIDATFTDDLENLKSGLRAGIAVPLESQGRIVASLTLLSEQVGFYGSREKSIIERLASQIAPAIENAGLFEDSQRAECENALLAEIGRIISSSLDINEVYEHFADTVNNLIEFDRIGISLIDEGKNSLALTYVSGTTVAGRQCGDITPLAGTQVEEVLRTEAPSLLVYENEADLKREFPGLSPSFAGGMRSFLYQ